MSNNYPESGIMVLQTINAHCPKCGSKFSSIQKRTFLGFQRLTCPRCAAKVVHPLTPGFRVTYWVLLGIMIILFVDAVSRGGFAVPGVIGVAVVIAIIKDMSLRKQVAMAAKELNDVRPSKGSERSVATANSQNSQAAHAPLSTTQTQQVTSMNQLMDNLEDRAYEQVGKELDSNNLEKGTWAKAFSQAGGDEKQTAVLYIKWRVEKLINAERIRLEELRRSQKELARVTEEERIRRMPTRERMTTGKVADAEIRRLAESGDSIRFLNQCRRGELGDITAMLEREPNLIAVTDNEGNTALHIAVQERNQRLIHLLVDVGASPWVPNGIGKTPIDLAQSKRMVNVVRFLQQK